MAQKCKKFLLSSLRPQTLLKKPEGPPSHQSPLSSSLPYNSCKLSNSLTAVYQSAKRGFLLDPLSLYPIRRLQKPFDSICKRVMSFPQASTQGHMLTCWVLFVVHPPLSDTHRGGSQGFSGGPVVKSLPCNAEDTDSVPGWGRSHMPWSN